MRSCLIAVICMVLLVPALLSQSRSALETDPSGWKDLLADKSLKGWVRGPLGAAGQLRPGNMDDPNPFTLDSTGTMVICEGDRVGHEWLRWGEELSNFVAHAEFRFPVVPGEPKYNAGVFVRTNTDGSIWHQAQATMGGGYLFGNTPVNGVPQRVNLRDKMPENRVKQAGEWNAYELRCAGDQVSLWVNGGITGEMKCEVPRGFFGIEAEGYKVEYRNIRIKLLK